MSNGFSKVNVECDVGFLVSYTKLLFRESHTCKREVEVYEPKVLAFEFSLVIVLWFQIEYGKTHKSLGFIMHSKIWEIVQNASRLWQNFLKICAENYSK